MKRFVQVVQAIAVSAALATSCVAFAGQPTLKPVKGASSKNMPHVLTPKTILEMSRKGSIKADQLLVKYRQPVAASASGGAYSALKLKQVEAIRGGNNKLKGHFGELAKWHIVTFDKSQNLGQAYKMLAGNRDIEYVVPNAVYHVKATPNDLTPKLWGLNNTGQTISIPDGNGGSTNIVTTPGADVRGPLAWNIRTDASNVVVAVIDTGVNYRHPDLAANMWVNPGEIAGNGIDDDNNGYIDDVYGYDTAGNDPDPMDTYGHGSHVAGTIAGRGDNGQGITGVAWKAKIMAVKVFADESGFAYTSDLVKGIAYAADMGAKVSNNSWGSMFYSAVDAGLFEKPLFDAIGAANNAGMLFVAAAGNDGQDLESGSDYGHYMNAPSGLELPNVVSVGASDYADQIASFSNYGAVEVDLFAPGVAIYSTVLGSDYDFYNGTSMATPHVVGVAALLYAVKPDLKPYEVRAILMQSVDQLPQMNGKAHSGGRLNAFKALKRLAEGAGCPSFTAKITDHVTAQRAVARTVWFTTTYYATGSNENLGTVGTKVVTLTENTAGSWSTSTACNRPLNLPPVVLMTGAPEANVLVGKPYTIPGATATDRESGNLTTSIVRTGTVNTAVPGDYVINYNVTDAAGNAAVTAKRVVHVLAFDTPPTIYLFGPQCSPLYCVAQKMQVGTSYSEPGYLASDEIDGDMTSKVVRLGTPDMNRIGQSNVTYEATDTAGNKAQSGWFRIAFVLDVNKPFIWMNVWYDQQTNSDVTFAYRSNRDYWYSPSFAAIDLKDEAQATTSIVIKDSLGNIVPGNTIYFDRVQNYRVEVTATDSEGYTDFKVQNVRVVVDSTPPVITLNGPAHVEIPYGGQWNDPWANITDDISLYPSLSGRMYDSSGNEIYNLDTTKPGTYRERFTGSDDVGNQAAPVERTIVVKPQFVPQCKYDTNVNHKTAGRAYTKTVNWVTTYYAQGSNNSLGTSALTKTYLKETSAGYWVKASSCP